MTVKFPWILSSFLGVFLASYPVEAASLTSWHYNAKAHRLELKTDKGVQPKAQLVFNPTRLVIDLPGIITEKPTTHKRISSSIKDVRVGKLDTQTTRIVVELAPGYTLDANKVVAKGASPNRWFFQLPIPQRIANYDSHPVAEEKPTYKQIAYTPSTVSRAEEKPTYKQIAYTPSTVSREEKNVYSFAGVLNLGSEMTEVEPEVKALISKYSFLSSGMFFLDLDTGNYLDIDGGRVFPAASTIKLPILIAFFQDVDAGKASLDETLVMRRDLMAGGSGVMQYQKPGTKYSVKETLWKMITISDNTATNMIIARLGGIARVNQKFRSWGLKDTVINHLLADLKGTNKTSSKDMVRVLALLVNDKLVSASSKEQVLDILRHTKTRTLLPAGLEPGADISHKTGDIGFIIGDAGLITMPTGKRYLAAIYVRRPYKDPRGRNFIRQVSHSVYHYLQQPLTSLPYRS